MVAGFAIAVKRRRQGPLSSFVYVWENTLTLHWLPVVEWDHWVVKILRVRSPLSVRLECGEFPEQNTIFEAFGRDGSLWEVSSWLAFHEIPASGVRHIGQEIGLDTSAMAGLSLPNLILVVASAGLGKELTEDEQLEILRHRLRKGEQAAKDLLELIEIEEILEKKDVKDIKKNTDKTEAAASEVTKTLKEILERKKDCCILQLMQKT